MIDAILIEKTKDIISPEFEKELENLINSYGVDSYVGVPDYLLAEIIMGYIDFTRFCVEKINKR